MVRRAAATAVLLLGALAGCSLEGAAKSAPVEPEPSPTPTTTPAPVGTDRAAEPHGLTEARAGLRKALRTLTRAGTGGFSSRWSSGDGDRTTTFEYEGTFDLGTLQSDYVAELRTADGSLRTQVKSTLEDAWFSILEVPGAVPDQGCWVHYDAGALAELTGAAIPDSLGQGFPAHLSALYTARATGFHSTSDINATADLYSVASVFSGQTPSKLGIPYESRDRVPIVVHLADGELAGWSADLLDVLAAARKADYLPRALRRLLTTQGESAFRSTITTRLEAGRSWTFDAPRPRDVIEMSPDADAFDTAMRVCTGLGQTTA